MDKIIASKAEMNRIAARAKTTFDVATEICILRAKAFKPMTGSSERGGTYNYFQDRVLINQNVAELRTLPHLEWTIFHEYGHAYFARTFARNSFIPMIVHAPWVEDELIKNGIRHMWNGLCDCFVNELVFRKVGLKKFDPTIEETLDNMSKELPSGMCFHLYDYWKHGRNEQVAQKAKEKSPPEILSVLRSKLSLTTLDNPIDQMVGALAFIGNQLFQIRICRKAMSKREIEKSAGFTLPKFWGEENSNLELLELTQRVLSRN
jgi:hypothetical protein